jgi:hypothetical protein
MLHSYYTAVTLVLLWCCIALKLLLRQLHTPSVRARARPLFRPNLIELEGSMFGDGIDLPCLAVCTVCVACGASEHLRAGA